jgi:predicted aspartyl protease
LVNFLIIDTLIIILIGVFAMGMFQVPVIIANPKDPNQHFEEKFWVDTGALYSFVPENRLTAIGIEPLKTRDLILADGRKDKRLLGEALFTIEELDETMTCPVIFAPKDSLYLLGATALENFGVDVDPAAKQLKPILGIIGGFPGSKSFHEGYR